MTMKRFFAALALLVMLVLLFAAPCALAQSQRYVFGGSGTDMIGAMAVSADGRIVMTGHTDSADGTLAARTKTGRSGWALCVDAQGEVIWSFCSRNGSADVMDAPVFHEDGSVSLILQSDGAQKELVELIRLDAAGEVILRETLLESEDPDRGLTMLRPRAYAGGYVLGITNGVTFIPEYAYFDFSGNLIKSASYEKDRGVMAVSSAHSIAYSEGAYWFHALSFGGVESPLAKLFEVGKDTMLPMNYPRLISLEDGGAAGCGWQLEAGEQSGLFTRWDEQGNPVCGSVIPGMKLQDMVKTRTGYAALCVQADAQAGDVYAYTLLHLDEQGMMTGTPHVVAESIQYGAAMGMLPDGRIALATMQDGENPDVVLTVIPAQ